jgi:hypothetical protein
VDARTPNGRTLTWTQPAGAAPQVQAAPAAVNPTAVRPAVAAAPVPQPQPQPQLQPQVQPQQVAASNEGAVSVPTDGDPLRFPLPTAQPPEASAPIASAPPLPTQPQPAQPIAPQPLQQPPNVQLATYNAPIPSAPPLPTHVPVASQPAQVNSPWRSPQIALTAAAPMGTPQLAPPQQYGAVPIALPPPPAAPPNTIAATLRAVEAPPQPGDPMPRVRMPNYVASQASADGFRPRTSMQ